MTSESDEKIMAAADDANDGGNNPLKKGPWTSAEDAILVEYVSKYGEGNWNAVQKNSGLARCGKSCRLRWANHLRPNLKKGAFSPEEEHLIVELHSKMGNKWARMAAELPGRTDNEIKNYWNTRIKRKHLEFKNPEMNHHHHLYPPPPLLDHNVPAKRLCGAGSFFPDYLSADIGSHFQTDNCLQIAQSFIQSCSSCSSSSSSSEPSDWPMMKMELPSLQTHVGGAMWGPPPSPTLPPLESVDTQTLLCDILPENRNSGLLDAVLYESRIMKNSKNQDFHETAYCDYSSPSLFSEGSTPTSGTSFDEPEYLENITGCEVKGGFETTKQMNFNRPDFLLDSDYIDPRQDFIEDVLLTEDAVGNFLWS
ncbi:hypothetical protein MIMGU_mgv1a008698mg [Erythranthe guttata]|uniref:Transcription factor n=1 Tax=Erythranthe guttata TaxID=4155 RepID=A0A022S042_ERYGU|nr:hypothetical protein MIMGU_mgv1a008698mg [Erythranthe guttata]